jgi:hypothetical protein
MKFKCSIAIKYNWKISVNKTKAMAMKGKMNLRTKIVIDNNIFKQVNSFNYLGHTIIATNNIYLEITMNRLNEKCSTIRGKLNNERRKETEVMFYNGMTVHTLTYGSGIWTITKEQKQKVETAGMKFLRSVAGYRNKGQIRNTKIREELNIFNLNDKILKSRSQWKYHVQRMEDTRIPKKILTYTPKRRRNIGRPQLQWRDQHTLQGDRTDHEWPNP